MRTPLRVGALACAVALLSAAPAVAAPQAIIVKFRPGTTALDRAAALGSARVVTTIHGLGSQVVAVADADATVARLQRDPNVAYAERDRVLRATAVPNDPRFGELYGMDRIDAPEGWDAAGLGTFPATGGVKVGIVDTGIRATHEDLSGKVADCAYIPTTLIATGTLREGSCADDNGHGTHVAGTIAAKANNALGVAGVAFDSPLGICKALGGPLGMGSTSGVAQCITWLADKGARVISMSLGGGASSTLQDAVRYAWKGGAGALLVAAAGNDGNSTQNYPAAYAEVVSVAATDSSDRRASFSNANADVEIAAPGVDVLSTYYSNNSSYTRLSGTSMATPHVSGVAAIIARRGGSAAAWRSELQSSVDDLGAAGRDAQFGFGRVNLYKAAT